MDLKEAIKIAKQTRENASAIRYTVGTCLVTKTGRAYSGCNIENHDILSICAERTAFVKALSEGENEFEYIVIVGAHKDSNLLEHCVPCGYCRQFMTQYAKPDFKIYACYGEDDTIKEYTLSELLPYSYSL